MSFYNPNSDESEVRGSFMINPSILHLYRGPLPYVPARPPIPDISSDQDSPNSDDESVTYIINPSYAPISQAHSAPLPYVYSKPSCAKSRVFSPSSDESEVRGTYIINPAMHQVYRGPPPYVPSKPTSFISRPSVFNPTSTDESENFIINPIPDISQDSPTSDPFFSPIPDISPDSPRSDPFHVCSAPPPYVFSPSSDESESRAKISIVSNIGPSYAMVASGCRRGGLLPKQYRQGGSSSSSSHKTCRQGDKTYLAIFCPSNMTHLLLIRVPLHSLLLTPPNKGNNKNILSYDLKKHYTSMSCLHPSELTKDFIDLLPAGSPHLESMCAVCTSSVAGLGPCIFLFNSRSNSKEVFRYNLHQPNMRFHRCADMPAANTLYVQIGDFLYGLSYAGQPVVQKYDIEKDIWTLVKDNIITRCTYSDQNNHSISNVPHVVINGKLHISLGYNSFAFDTQTDTWEYSNLFDTFWSHHNPFNFYGQLFWGMNGSANLEFAKRSFGFYGRGIVWDEDILLGVLCSPKCQLVAFQLIDNKVVKSQSFTFADHMFDGAKLVDLGQGYFGLLHFTISFFPPAGSDYCHQLELVTIMVSKPLQPRDDCFLECRIVRKDIVAQNLYYSMMHASDPFSV